MKFKFDELHVGRLHVKLVIKLSLYCLGLNVGFDWLIELYIIVPAVMDLGCTH